DEHSAHRHRRPARAGPRPLCRGRDQGHQRRLRVWAAGRLRLRQRLRGGGGRRARWGGAGGWGGGVARAEGPGFGAELYAALDRDQLPDPALLASLGCGNPTAVAELHQGETVLDLGSGGGIDVLLSAKRVGSTGRAYGLDMTE